MRILMVRDHTQFGEKMRAVTESGLTVHLNEDGTWIPAKSIEMQSVEGFRKISWGASPSEIKASEASEPHLAQDDYLDYEVRLGRFACLAVYVFVRGQFVRGKYLLLEDYQNLTSHLSDFEELKALVIKKYGAPIKDQTFWTNDLYKDDYSEWGMAVACGHLSKFTDWETAESKINLGLYGENFNVTVSVEYSGKAFESLEASVKEAELLGDL